MAQDKQGEITWQLINILTDAQNTLHDLEQVADNPKTVAAMREVVERIMHVYHGPDEDEGVDRQMLANACVMLAYQVLSEGYLPS